MYIVTEFQAQPKLSLNETFMSLIIHNAKSSASFAKYIAKEQARLKEEDLGFVPDDASPRSQKITGDARVAEQQLFTTDVLYELSKEFVYKAAAAPDLSSKPLSQFCKWMMLTLCCDVHYASIHFRFV